jgi:hypothetical protein
MIAIRASAASMLASALCILAATAPARDRACSAWSSAAAADLSNRCDRCSAASALARASAKARRSSFSDCPTAAEAASAVRASAPRMLALRRFTRQ